MSYRQPFDIRWVYEPDNRDDDFGYSRFKNYFLEKHYLFDKKYPDEGDYRLDEHKNFEKFEEEGNCKDRGDLKNDDEICIRINIFFEGKTQTVEYRPS